MDNIRDNSGLPYFYSSHEGEEEEDERLHDYTNDMKLCAYCGFEFASCYVHGIVITRHGKTRQMYRCDKCKQEMHSYKPSD